MCEKLFDCFSLDDMLSSAELQEIKKEGLIQPFGCLIVVDEETFSVLAYSENAPEMLDLVAIAVPNVEQHQQDGLPFGTDVRTLFLSSGVVVLQKATSFPEVDLFNPILLHCKTSGKPFYAILHRIDKGLVIDLEPVNPSDVPMSSSGALESYKLAAKAISSLQSVPGGNILLLCDVLVNEVMELTGYDCVVVYKFHEGEEGEVILECCRPGLEPYFLLHYPDTDISELARFLFRSSEVHMVHDYSAPMAKIIQGTKLPEPVSVGGSVFKAPYECYLKYMSSVGSMASLVMPMMVNEDGNTDKIVKLTGRKLWGLVVCHHRSPRLVPFPVRYACQCLIQVSSFRTNVEVKMAALGKKKHILQTQTLLCRMLVRGSPVEIVTHSPNVMDLVECEGAALYYKNKLWLLGSTPLKEQIEDLAMWLLGGDSNKTSFSTNSLMEAGYPGASQLGGAVSGVAAIRITSKDFIFWFRSCKAKEIRRGCTKHEFVYKDQDRRMHPRPSLHTLSEVGKWRTLPWDDVEMDAIHYLQLILRASTLKDNTYSSTGKLQTARSGIVSLIETAAVPILTSDVSGKITGLNAKAAQLMGLSLEKAIGAHLTNLVVDDIVDSIKGALSLVLQGKEEINFELRFKTPDCQEKSSPGTCMFNACCSQDIDGNVMGICFFGQEVTAQGKFMGEYVEMHSNYASLLWGPCLFMPPVFITNEHGICLEWSYSMQKLSGLNREKAIGRKLLGEVLVVGDSSFHVKDHGTLTRITTLLNGILAGEKPDKICFQFFDQNGKCTNALLSASPQIGNKERIIGALCFLDVSSPELTNALWMQHKSEEAASNSLKKLSYLLLQVRNPLSGMLSDRDLMESSQLSCKQKQLMKTRSLSEDQLAKVAEDPDLSSIEESYLVLSTGKFNLGKTLDSVVSQAMHLSQEKRVQLINDSPSELSSMHLYGDHLRLQQMLSDFLVNSVNFAPAAKGSSVIFTVFPRKASIGKKLQVVHLEFRITHQSPGIPEKLIQEMHYKNSNMSREGLILHMSENLVRIMNGTVEYLREDEHCSFVVRMEFPLLEDTIKVEAG